LATQVFAEEELERLRGFPEIGRDELFRFFTLAPADVAFVDPGRGRGPADRLGLSVALCTLPWLGFVPDDVVAAPPVAVARLADQLGVDPGVLRIYGRRAKTRTEHLRLVALYRGRRLPTSLEFTAGSVMPGGVSGIGARGAMERADLKRAGLVVLAAPRPRRSTSPAVEETEPQTQHDSGV